MLLIDVGAMESHLQTVAPWWTAATILLALEPRAGEIAGLAGKLGLGK